MRKLLLVVTVAGVLAGCGTRDVAPALLAIHGVVTTKDAEGYPVFDSVTFARKSPATVRLVAACLSAEIDGLEASPVVLGSSVKASGQASANTGLSNLFRYTLTVLPNSYVFSRLQHTGVANAGPALMASKWGNPQNSYEAMGKIVDRIDQCLAGG